jgi:hypothetical protein
MIPRLSEFGGLIENTPRAADNGRQIRSCFPLLIDSMDAGGENRNRDNSLRDKQEARVTRRWRVVTIIYTNLFSLKKSRPEQPSDASKYFPMMQISRETTIFWRRWGREVRSEMAIAWKFRPKMPSFVAEGRRVKEVRGDR